MSFLNRYRFVAHPFLLALFPVLFVYERSEQVVSLSELVVPITLVLLAALLLWGVLTPILRSANKAALITSTFMVLFLSYGHVTNAMNNFVFFIGSFYIGKNKIVIPTSVIIFSVTTYLVIRSRRHFDKLTSLLNRTSAALVAINLVIILVGFMGNKAVSAVPNHDWPTVETGEARPNIYFILLDGYGRADVLVNKYDFDNSPFLDSLRSRGFYVADSSRANYCQTCLSLCSIFNMIYLQDLAEEHGVDRLELTQIKDLIEYNRVFAFLRNQGYKVVSFATGYSFTEFAHADRYLSPRLSMTEFQSVLLYTTPLPVLMRYYFSQLDVHRNRILYILDKTASAGEDNYPALVFSDIVAPHPPFVFGQKGEALDPPREFGLADGPDFIDEGGSVQEYVKGYRGQLQYINKRALQLIDEILAGSSVPPVIILQSDHGPSAYVDWQSHDPAVLNERLRNLNAIYLPPVYRDRCTDQFYPRLSPVNNFRLVLSCLFGVDLPLRADSSYFSTHVDYFGFFAVPEYHADSTQ